MHIRNGLFNISSSSRLFLFPSQRLCTRHMISSLTRIDTLLLPLVAAEVPLQKQNGFERIRSNHGLIKMKQHYKKYKQNGNNDISTFHMQRRYISSSNAFNNVFEFVDSINPFGPSLATGKLGNLNDEYEVLEELGSGRFGVVKRAIHKESGREYAVKSITKSRVDSIHELKNEISILAKLAHPNVMKLFEVIEDRAQIHIITELYTGGELFDRIIQQGVFKESDAAMLMKQLFEALKYLHANGVVHRDIKPENLLLSSKDANARLVLVDFGLSGTYDPNASEKKVFHMQCGVSCLSDIFKIVS